MFHTNPFCCMKHFNFLLILCLIAVPALLAQAQGNYTVTVYNVNQSTGARGSVVTSNTQIQPNTTYEMTIRGNSPTPVAIFVTRLFDADFGCLCGSPQVWTPFADPTSNSGDVGTNNNYTRSFHFRTKSGVDFLRRMAIQARMYEINAYLAGQRVRDYAQNLIFPN